MAQEYKITPPSPDDGFDDLDGDCSDPAIEREVMRHVRSTTESTRPGRRQSTGEKVPKDLKRGPDKRWSCKPRSDASKAKGIVKKEEGQNCLIIRGLQKFNALDRRKRRREKNESKGSEPVSNTVVNSLHAMPVLASLPE